MRVVIDFTLIPVGTEVSLSPYIAECQKIIQSSGLEHHMHAYGTNIAGEWDDVFAVVKACHDKVHAMGAVRIASTIKLGTRTDKQQSLSDRVSSVNQQLKSS